jgi:hypothetical protein
VLVARRGCRAAIVPAPAVLAAAGGLGLPFKARAASVTVRSGGALLLTMLPPPPVLAPPCSRPLVESGSEVALPARSPVATCCVGGAAAARLSVSDAVLRCAAALPSAAVLPALGLRVGLAIDPVASVVAAAVAAATAATAVVALAGLPLSEVARLLLPPDGCLEDAEPSLRGRGRGRARLVAAAGRRALSYASISARILRATQCSKGESYN